MAVQLTCYGTEGGEPWGVFADGHIDRSLITLDAINEALDVQGGYDPVGGAMVDHLWMVHDEEDAGEEARYPWHWCEAGTPGAIAVTGVKFQ